MDSHNSAHLTQNLQWMNKRIAREVQKRDMVDASTVYQIMNECNRKQLHLGQILTQRGLLKVVDLAEIMRCLQRDTTVQDQVPAAIKALPHIDGLNKVFLGNCEIIEKITQGGMGIVYKARQSGINRIVALKVLIHGSQANAAQIRRFLRESKAVSQLQHPNIIPIYSIGEENNHHYFTMEYMPGGTFHNIINCDQTSLQEKLQIVSKICKALHHAHKQGIIHRDIKPSNILLDEHRQPYLADFGLAKNIDNDSMLTQTSINIGTPFYMAPEQIDAPKNRKPNPQSDIYSLGVVLYQVLTGALPFVADNLLKLYHQINQGRVVPPRACNNDVPVPVEQICLKALDKSLKYRYKSALAMANDLDSFLQQPKLPMYKLSMQRYISQYSRALLIAFLALSLLTISHGNII